MDSDRNLGDDCYGRDMMSLLADESSQLRYRLRGPIDAIDTVFDLDVGEHRIGSSPASDIRLPIDGVSREHAVLRVTPAGLAVEDRGSKNGTFIDGRRVDRSGIPAGARLGFGPIELELEAVDPDDAELAFVLDPVHREGHSGPTFHGSRETASVLGSADPSIQESWLLLVAGFAERLYSPGEGNLAEAVEFLRQLLGGAAACVVEWCDDGQPVILAARGAEIQDLLRAIPGTHQLESLISLPKGLSPSRGWRFRSTAKHTTAGLVESVDHPLALVIWGDFPDRPRSESLFRVVLQLVDRWRSHASCQNASPNGSSRHPELHFPVGYLAGNSPPMRTLYRQMQAALTSDMPILIIGETGVGKEQLATILHQSSDSKDGPLIAINCAAIPADLLEAELFGIGKGVATGVDRRVGKFQLAEGGTLFLDEIGEMAPALQAKLLRALQEKQIQPVGGPSKRINLRIVAATNADLEQRMTDGSFRRDLYYRLAGYTLRVPPLRECSSDVQALVEHFLREFTQQAGTRIHGLSVKALRALATYSWPGNVRELQHELLRLVSQCAEGGTIVAKMLSPRLLSRDESLSEGSREAVAEDLRLAPNLQQLERRLIEEALRRAGGRQVHAAKLLGISRNGLADKLKRFGIDPMSSLETA